MGKETELKLDGHIKNYTNRLKARSTDENRTNVRSADQNKC